MAGRDAENAAEAEPPPMARAVLFDLCTMCTRARDKTRHGGVLTIIVATAVLTGCGGSTIGGATPDGSA